MEHHSANLNTVIDSQLSSLREHILKAIEVYFKTTGEGSELNNGNTLPIISAENIVMEEVESAMYEGVMRVTQGNQSKAAKILGVSRGTLRTKLVQYFGTTHVGGVYRSSFKP